MNRERLILFDGAHQGSGYKVRLLLSQMNLDYTYVCLNVAADKEQATPEFLQLNPKGQIPALYYDGKLLTESNAMLLFLASNFGDGKFWPNARQDRLDVMSWLEFSSRRIDSGGAVQMFRYFGRSKEDAVDSKYRHEARMETIGVVETLDAHLRDRQFMVSNYSIADVACFGYIDFLPYLGFELAPYKNVESWTQRCRRIPGFIPMPLYFSEYHRWINAFG